MAEQQYPEPTVVNQDGWSDIVTKVWNKDGATYHVDYWRNDTPRSDSLDAFKKPAGPIRSSERPSGD
jgi:hypothetical protein